MWYQRERKKWGSTLQPYFTFIAPINQEMSQYRKKKREIDLQMEKTVKPKT